MSCRINALRACTERVNGNIQRKSRRVLNSRPLKENRERRMRVGPKKSRNWNAGCTALDGEPGRSKTLCTPRLISRVSPLSVGRVSTPTCISAERTKEYKSRASRSGWWRIWIKYSHHHRHLTSYGVFDPDTQKRVASAKPIFDNVMEQAAEIRLLCGRQIGLAPERLP